jgi:broad specificity phosphatase PhoE
LRTCGAIAGIVQTTCANADAAQTTGTDAETVQTAEMIAGELQVSTAAANPASCNSEVRSRKDLREIDFGDWEGLTYDEIKSVDGAQFDAWLADYTSTKIPGGESWIDFTSRITAAVLDILENAGKDDTIVIVTHGGPIRLITSCFVEDADHFKNFWPAPGSVHVLDIVRHVNEGIGDPAEGIRSAADCIKNDAESGTGNDAMHGIGGSGDSVDMIDNGTERNSDKNNCQTIACLKLSRAYKLDNYRFNLQIS